MSRSSLSTGRVCMDDISGHVLKRDVLPNHGENYRGTREQNDRHRFIAFTKSAAATVLNDSLNDSYDPIPFKQDT